MGVEQNIRGFGDVCIIPRSHADARVAVFSEGQN